MKNTKNNHTTTYCYLGNELDPSLSMSQNFEKGYKKASGRLNLLAKMRLFLSVKTTFKIFETIFVPVLMYSSLIHLQLTKRGENTDDEALMVVKKDLWDRAQSEEKIL